MTPFKQNSRRKKKPRLSQQKAKQCLPEATSRERGNKKGQNDADVGTLCHDCGDW
jgi:hypothetical protein